MTDAEILALYFARDERAIAETAARCGRVCASLARNILGSAEDAEECVSDAYLRAWNAIPPTCPESLTAYLARLTRNAALHRYARAAAEKRGGGQTAAVLDELAELVPGGVRPEEELDRRELLRDVEEFLAGLPAKKRAIFICRCWYFDSVGDIARSFGMTENSVSVTLCRLRRALRDHLTERGYDK